MIWPLPALLTWAAAWGLFILLQRAGAPLAVSLALPAALGAAVAVLGGTRWRRVFIALGFPLSVIVLGAGAGWPAWSWLLPLAALLALYPLNAWNDAPVFPTPKGALDGLAKVAPLPAGARILDAGCGLGDGLIELHRQYPQAELEGWEWSWPLVLMCRLRCRLRGVPVRVRRVDIWQADWSPFAMVYVFQRPESMTRCMEKADAELGRRGWLVSLAFPVADRAPKRVLNEDSPRAAWLYAAGASR